LALKGETGGCNTSFAYSPKLKAVPRYYSR
jgi:hypothetical protein